MSVAQKQILFVFLLVMALTAVLSLYLTSKIVKPIKTLEAGTFLVAGGKFDSHVNIQTGDELEQLGSAFNKMMDGLKQLQQLKDEFVFIASHELRTPVTAMKGYLSMVLAGEAGTVNKEAKELLAKVSSANQRLVQLVDDLLEVARSEAGKLSIETSALDLVQTIQAVLSELTPLFKEKKLSLKFEAAKNMHNVKADPQRLKEVLVNLIGNAVKYTPAPGQVTITLEQQGSQIVTNITDSGIGMSQAEQSKLFEKFYRIKNAHTENIQGTGLGLFIVKQIVEKMNGKIWVKSKTGAGSTFSFSLPKA